MIKARFLLDDYPRSNISQTLGQYLGAPVQCLRGSWDGLGVRIHPGEERFPVLVGDVIGVHAHGSARVKWFAVVGVALRDGTLLREKADHRLCPTLIERFPLTEDVYLRTTVPVLMLEGPRAGMANLIKLYFKDGSAPA